MTTSTAVPVKKICKALLCFARYFPVYPIWFCALALKSKLRGANKAEAQVVVPVRRSVVVPVANRRVVGVVVPRTTPRVLFTKLGKLCVFYTVRTRRRAEPCCFCRKIPFFFSLFFCRKNATAKPLVLPRLRLHGLRLLSAPI